jgi:signal transduction histidine kinase
MSWLKRPFVWSYDLVYYLTVSLVFAAVLLRSLLLYAPLPGALPPVLGLLAAWLALFICEPALTRRWRKFFLVYLAIQAALSTILLFSPDPPDYFALLFAILSLQAMNKLDPKSGTIWIGAFTVLMLPPLAIHSGVPTAIAFGLIYSAADALFGANALASRRALEARTRNQTLLKELQENNQKLQVYSKQLEQLAVARERGRLGRELHDSVTQTIFSMTLTTQSAMLLLQSNPARVKSQLDRLEELAHSAMAEMQTLISELRPPETAEGGLAAALRQHLAERHLPESLAVALEAEGSASLSPAEEQSLFRIAQEALNNVVKHAQASQACLRLHLEEPAWIEIEDNGQGFDPQHARRAGRVGLSSMSERAAEIGWVLAVFSEPGKGTRIRVTKHG